MGIKRIADSVWNRTSIRVKWEFLSRIPGWKGITDKKYEHEIVVSLTSFPARIEDVVYTIRSLLLQSMKPNRIILWLADSQFPLKENELPAKLLLLKNKGLEIRWCEDIRSYKKLIPTLREYPEAIIVTSDDDLYYRDNWLERLYQSYLEDNSLIWAHRITKFTIKKGKFKTIPGGRELWNGASYLHKFTGCGGVLYPPNILDSDVLRVDRIFELCPTNDDIWFWLMAVKNNVKIAVPEKPQVGLLYVGKTQEGPTLTSINDRGEKFFWKDFYSVLGAYPEIEEKLRDEVEVRMNA